MLQTALYTAAAGMLGMYIDAKTGLREDLRLLSAAKTVPRATEKAAKEGKLSLFHVLEEQNTVRPDAPSLYYAPADYQETWSMTYANVLRMAAFFSSKNVRAGEIVAVEYTNKPTFIHIWLALDAVGAAPAFLNYNLSGEPLLHCLRVSNSKLLIVDEELTYQIVPSKRKIEDLGLSILVFDERQLNEIHSLPLRSPEYDATKNELTKISCIFFTSGTTGLPKPAIFALSRWFGAGLLIGKYLRVTPEDRFYTCMPLYHGTGSSCFIMCLFQGSCFCLGHKFSVSRYWDEVRRSRATIINYVGETCRYLIGAPTSSEDRNNLVHSAYGNGLRPDIWEAFRDRFSIQNILEFYGASEALVSTLNYNSGPEGVGSVGRYGALQRYLTRNDLLAIRVDPDTQQPFRGTDGLCTVVSANEPGELMMRIPDPSMYAGYYQDPAASKKKVLQNVLEPGDMWFRSGDLMQRSKRGHWYFVDRLGDTFRWKSENVSTMEVAAVLAGFSGVADVCVYGVALPSHDGRAGCAAIVPRDDTSIDFQLLAAFAKQSLPKYAVPLFIRIMQTMPKTENNKPQKGLLKLDGVDPLKVLEEDGLYWLKGGSVAGQEYVRFTKEDWMELGSGRVSL